MNIAEQHEREVKGKGKERSRVEVRMYKGDGTGLTAGGIPLAFPE